MKWEASKSVSLTDSIIVQEPDRFAGYLIALIIVLALASSLTAVNLTQGQCVTDANSSIEYCAPPNLAGQTVQLAYPSFGVTEKLNHSCASGEFVKGATAPFQNQNALLQPNSTNLTFVPYFNFTMACTAGNVTVLNDTVYVNNTIVQKPRLDTEQQLGFGDKYWNYDMNLSISCPDFPKINDIWQLAPAEKKRVDEYNLIVSCANSSEMCPIVAPITQIVNGENCTNTTIEVPPSYQACVGVMAVAATPQPSGITGFLTSDSTTLILVLIGVIVLGVAGNKFLKDEKKKKGEAEVKNG
jgi:hypothetical protein